MSDNNQDSVAENEEVKAEGAAEEAQDQETAAPVSDKEIILVAEDSPPNRKILIHLLQKLGYEVVGCENGEQAWEEAQKLRGNEKFVAIISDIMMPVKDGIDLLRSVRGDDELKDLPVVLVTAVSDKEYILEAKSMNVNGYILKPVTFARVTAKLQELFPDKKINKIAS
ncbi:MAG: response regulator [Bdellovibrionales bacterium]|nr:response regulator [Bdellovibrionales bacterium]